MNPQICQCRFCGEPKSPQGITNHETYCDENPHHGVPADAQAELGLLESDEPDGNTTEDEKTTADTNETRLPPRESLSSNESPSPEPAVDESTCDHCGSTDLVLASTARKHYQRKHSETDPVLIKCFSSAEQYCNECTALFGGEFLRPVTLFELYDQEAP